MGNEDVAAILHDIAGQKPKLDNEEELDLYCRLICILEPGSNTVDVKLPLRDGSLLSAAECSYPDQDKIEVLSSGLSSNKLRKFKLVHHSLTKEAAKFGAKKLSSLLAGAKPIKFLQPYGQKEPLTRRLQRILEDYPAGSGILKELVQNADDARASEVKIMVDWRGIGQAPSQGSRLLDPRLSAWQGPAIWAYNDAVFSDEDFDNITQLAGATKEAQTGKIGRFGLGFNAVYHLTDLPSFVSRRFVAFFDPHAEYLPDVSPAEPGAKIDFIEQQEELKQVYPDQFQLYQGVFGCQVLDCASADGFKGTLFRFPLRTNEVVSKICTTVYTDDRLLELIQAFVNDFDELLLFLQFVRKVSVYELHGQASDPSQAHLLCSCELSVDGELLVQEGLSRPRHPTSLLFQLVEGQASKNKLQQWSTSGQRQTRASQASRLPLVMYEASVSISSRREGQKKSRLPVKVTPQTQKWIVCSGVGGGDALQTAASSSGRLFPWGGVSLRLAEGKLEALQARKSRLFCFLPLPLTASLPFHINGYFAVAKTRRSLHYNADKDDKTKWNVSLMSNVCPPLLAELLHKRQPSISNGMSSEEALGLLSQQYFHVWPESTDDPCTAHFVNAFYRHQLSGDCNPSLIWTPINGGEWRCIDDCFLLDAQSKLPGSAFHVATDVLGALAKPVAVVPNHIKAKLMINGMSTMDFQQFSTTLFSNLERVDPDSRNCLIQHMLMLSPDEPWLSELLKSHACVPTSEGSLKTPRQLIDPTCTTLHGIYLAEDDRFPEEQFYTNRGKSLLNSLKRLGMQSGHLNVEDIAERCRSVEALAERSLENGHTRARAICKYLESPVLSHKDMEHLGKSLPTIRFLPVLRPPRDHPLKWWSHKNTALFVSGCVAWPQHLEKLLCTQVPLIDVQPLGVSSRANALKLCGVPRKKNVLLPHVLGQLKEVVGLKGSLPSKINEDCLAMLESTALEIYKYLNDTSDPDQSSGIEDPEVREVQRFLSSEAWIFHEGQFYPSKAFAMKWEDGEFIPHLAKVPEQLRRQKNLLKLAGVREEFDRERFLEVMSTLHNHRSRRAATKREIALLLRLAEKIRDSKPRMDRVDLRNRVVLPDSIGHLYFAKDLSYDDMPWLPASKKGKHHFLHKDVPRDLAICLGMPTLRETRSGGLSDDRLRLFGRKFGQKVRLTDQLEQILRKYPADVSILKELIQNADDAGATEIHFVVDKTKYESEKLFFVDECWSSLQEAPALCVFNNRPFTDKDMEGICHVGRGGKRDDASTIGRFGIGFNAVYHLTDCPMFLSRGPRGKPQDLCVFDPRLEYCPCADEEDPGHHWPVGGDQEKEFAHQFSPFLKQHLPEIASAEHGSVVFRFPLRSREPEMSMYSAKTWSASEIEELLQQLAEDAGMFLLFVNNLTILKASVKDGSCLKPLFEVSVDLDDAALAKRRTLAQAVKEFSPEAPNIFTQVAYEMKVKQHVTGQQVRQQKPGEERMDGASSYGGVAGLKKTQSTKRKAKSEGKDTDNGKRVEEWLVHQTLGVHPEQWNGDLASVLAEGHDYSLLPRCGVAIPLHDTELKSGRVFTFLPLPEPTGLPVHLNAHFVLDDARKTISKSSRKNDIDNVWNTFILSTLLPMQYAEALCTQSPEIRDARCVVNEILQSADQSSFEKTARWFYDLFSNKNPIEHTSPTWNQLTRSVFTLLAKQKSDILLQQPMVAADEVEEARAEAAEGTDKAESSSRSTWVTRYGDVSKLEWFPLTGVDKGVFHSLLQLQFPYPRNEYLMNLLLQCKMRLSCAPAALRRDLQGHDIKDLNELSAEFVRLFLTKLSPKQIPSRMPFASQCHDILVKNTTSLLRYCLSDLPKPSQRSSWQSSSLHRTQEQVEQEKVDRWLEGLPLLLRADGSLTTFSDIDPVYPPDFCNLVPEISRRFVDKQLWESTPLDSIIIHGYQVVRQSNIVTTLPVPCFAENVSNQDLPQEYRSGRCEPWDGTGGDAPSTTWLRLMWRYLVNCNDKEVLKVCGQFSVLPTTNNNLMPLDQVGTVGCPVSTSLGQHQQSLAQTMKNLGCPFLDEKRLASGTETLALPGIRRFLRTHLADISNHRDAIRCLSRVETLHPYREEPGRLDELLHHLLVSDLDDEDQARLRRLKLFPTMNGERVSLEVGQVAFWPSSMPGCGLDIDALANEANIVLLDPNSSVAYLIESKLGVEEIGIAELYDRHLFTQLKAMRHNHMIEHLDYINQNVSFHDQPALGEDIKSLLRKLETLPFVTACWCNTCQREVSSLNDKCIHFHTAREMFDPSHTVYGIRCRKADFPANCWLRRGPPPFGKQRSWRSILEALGLQYQLREDRFLEYAREI